jgi:hypothetical protein
MFFLIECTSCMFQKSTCCGSNILQVMEVMMEKCDRDNFVLFVGITRKDLIPKKCSDS